MPLFSSRLLWRAYHLGWARSLDLWSSVYTFQLIIWFWCTVVGWIVQSYPTSFQSRPIQGSSSCSPLSGYTPCIRIPLGNVPPRYVSVWHLSRLVRELIELTFANTSANYLNISLKYIRADLKWYYETKIVLQIQYGIPRISEQTISANIIK